MDEFTGRSPAYSYFGLLSNVWVLRGEGDCCAGATPLFTSPTVRQQLFFFSLFSSKLIGLLETWCEIPSSEVFLLMKCIYSTRLITVAHRLRVTRTHMQPQAKPHRDPTGRRDERTISYCKAGNLSVRSSRFPVNCSLHCDFTFCSVFCRGTKGAPCRLWCNCVM